ncbi:hypothetical protein N0V90_013180 [Kalmusia sp. IMI 367209]|nr:hypothetical protein N0V90_013180 [Kalmusia sp. IMI 367209]
MSSMRLNLNHFWLSRLTKCLLHPKIEFDQTSVKVVDLGAGTGIWASELTAELPDTATVKAFDISDKQFPPPGWRGRVDFKTVDCFKPIPEEYRGQFDVVNLRFWLCIVNDDSAEALLENILTLLKPGGYIQWFESLPLTAQVLTRNNREPTPGSDALVQQWYKPAGHSSYEWVMKLSKLFVESGLEVVADDTLGNLDHYQTVAQQSWLAGIQEYAYQQMQGDELEAFQKQLIIETEAGAFVDVKYTLVVGRKRT